MSSSAALRALLLALSLAWAAPCAGCEGLSDRAASAQAPPALRRVRLAATHPDGVPLHDHPGQRAFAGRLPDGLEVEVLEEADGGHWLRVRGAGRTGWIVRRYVAVPSASEDPRPAPEATAPSSDPASPWASPGACEAALARAPRAPRPGPGLRLATWNVRWFPDGHAHPPEPGGGTDVGWLACVVASMDLDALAVQEWGTHLRARRASADLLDRLEALTGHRWDQAFDDCPDDHRQHVGILWDTVRVEVRGARTVGRLNPGRSACQNRLRPGFTATVGRPGGRVVQLLVVHLDSGIQRRDRSNRRASARYLARLGELLPELGAGRGVVVVGDFNTMGCRGCDPRSTSGEEVAGLTDLLAAGSPPLRPAPGAPACSAYYRGHPSLLDHVFVGGALDPSRARVTLTGPCAVDGCGDLHGSSPPALVRLSDHCPLVLELEP